MVYKGVRQKEGKGRARKPADPAYLERAALFYLERFATTQGHMASVLRRKVRRRGLAEGVSEAEAEAWIAQLVEKLVRLGYIDDLGFARARAQSLLTRGKPLRAIRQALIAKSVPGPLIDEVLEGLAQESNHADQLAALRYVRRRRLGPARPDVSGEDEETAYRRRQRDLAAMARAGFSFDIAKSVLDLESAQDLDDLEYELTQPGN